MSYEYLKEASIMSPNVQQLVENDEIHFRRKIAELNQWTISIFIDRNGDSNTFAESSHNASPISDGHYNSLKSSIERLNALIGVDLKLVDNQDLADIKYYHHSYDVTSGDASGVNSYSYSYTGSLENPEYADWGYNHISVNDFSEESWAFISSHEIGHALGLEHPFEGEDGDVYGDTYTATSDQTVMAYGYPSNGIYPDFYTSVDISALQQIWGLPGSGRKMTGDAFNNLLTGESGRIGVIF